MTGAGKKKILRSLGAFGLGLLFTFFLAEVSIRILGRLNFSHTEITPGKKEEFRIACFGNSHTYGFGVPKGRAYSYVLEDFFKMERPEFPVRVLNHGLGNANTSNVLSRLKEVLPVEHPDLVLLMTGEPNHWNKEGYETFLIDQEGYVGDEGRHLPLVSLLSRSRLIRWFLMLRYEEKEKTLSPDQWTEREAYRLLGKHFFTLTGQNYHENEARHITEMVTKFLKLRESDPPVSIREFLILLARVQWHHYQNQERALDLIEESLRKYPLERNPLVLYTLAIFRHSLGKKVKNQRLDTLIEETLSVIPKDRRPLYYDMVSGKLQLTKGDPRIPVVEELRRLIPAETFLHNTLADYYRENGELGKAVAVAADLLRANPIQQQTARIYDFFSLERLADYPEKIRDAAASARDDFLRRFPTESYLLAGSGLDKVEAWIKWDIGRMVNLTRAAKAKPVLQTYHYLRSLPFREKLRGSILEAAKENSVELNDVGPRFQRELGEDIDSYYISLYGLPPGDAHPNERGHRLIARIIYDDLNARELLPPELRNLDSRKIYRLKGE